MTEPKIIHSLSDLSPDQTNLYQAASIKTIGNLKGVAQSFAQVSRLSLPEVDAVVEQVAQVVPAGNVPGVLLNGLARLTERKPPEKTVKRDIGLLFKGVRQALDKAVYGVAFAGPAAVIWGYQNLLKLSGKDPDESLPNGTWQFYLTYALREDAARHLTESTGFDAALTRHNITLSEADRVTAWVLALIHCLHQYNDMLANEWRERIYCYFLRELTVNEAEAAKYVALYQTWEAQRPFTRGQDAQPTDTYPIYRRRKFDEFFNEATQSLAPSLKSRLQEQIATAEAEQLPAYQQQMTILAHLEADGDSENRVLFDIKEAHVGVIHQGRYYLIPACAPRSHTPPDIAAVRAQIVTLMAYPAHSHPSKLSPLATMKRAEWVTLGKRLNDDLTKDLALLRTTPILFNADRRDPTLSLTEIRQTERGVGNHPMTLFDTGQAIFFEQAHIFFDGGWAVSLAESVTNEALSWAVYLSQLPAPGQQQSRPHCPALALKPADLQLLEKVDHVAAESSASNSSVNITFLQRLRQLFKRRNDLLELTANDLLILYRAIHGLTYQPSASLVAQLNDLKKDSATRGAAEAALQAIAEANQINPAMVIPVDASLRSPRDRLHPMTFEVPLVELDLIKLHQRVITALDGYKNGTGDRTALYAEFDKYQRTYLASLAGFGMVLGRSHEIANAGKSTTINLLAQMPISLQKMFEKMPSRFDVLNDLIRGREVFMNVGQAPARSGLKRFMSAKDDSDKKLLSWGVLTGSGNVMHITLRDARPHVQPLVQADQKAVATAITQDYLDSYVNGLNSYIQDLWRITESSRETRLIRDAEVQMLDELERKKREG